MDLPINANEPQIMHIDLNSCFATVEQQANPLLRGRPIAVAAYASPAGCVLAPSIEAKQHGIRVGMNVRMARLLYPPLVVLEPDPPKYRHVHQMMRKVLRNYTDKITPKSIDEVVIDFSDSRLLNPRPLTDIGSEIKQRFRAEIGEWISCSIGISTNRFLAKVAAGLQKPDGLEVIAAGDLLEVYARLRLLDLPGINVRYEARLNAATIHTPLDFYRAPLRLLHKQVFRSVNGYYWYLRLRGWEIDAVDFKRRSYGQSYALPKPTAEPKELSRLLMKLCEKAGRRMRRAQYTATAVSISCLYRDHTHWARSRHAHRELSSTYER